MCVVISLILSTLVNGSDISLATASFLDSTKLISFCIRAVSASMFGEFGSKVSNSLFNCSITSSDLASCQAFSFFACVNLSNSITLSGSKPACVSSKLLGIKGGT